MKKNEKGFSTVVVLLLLIIVALIGFAGWQVKKNADKDLSASQTSQQSTKTNAKHTNVYAGWKTYVSEDEKFSIKYPDGWTVTNESAEGNLKESVALMGPNNFDLRYTLVKYDASFTVKSAQDEASAVGNPDPTKSNAYNVIDSLKPKNYSQTLYVVSMSSDVGEPGGLVNNIALAAFKSYSSQPLGYPSYYLAKNNAGYIVQWFGAYSKNAPSAGPIGMPTATFLAKDEVKTATLILKSIAY